MTKANIAKNDNANPAFKAGDMVVYPRHGVGRVTGIEAATVGGDVVHMYAVSFESERMSLKVPVFRARTLGLRPLSSTDRMGQALETITGRPRIRRTMWSRRAAEYEAKINSGDPVVVAEVLRDLKRVRTDVEQSYSERQIYQHALQRLARELAAIDGTGEDAAADKLEAIMGVAKEAPVDLGELDSDSARRAAEMIARARKAA